MTTVASDNSEYILLNLRVVPYKWCYLHYREFRQAPQPMDPPTEPPRAKRTRNLIVIAVSIFVLVFGAPLFLYTTRIHRADLPIPLVQRKLADFQETIKLDVPVYFDNVPADVLERAQSLVDQALKERHHLRLWGLSLRPKMEDASESLQVSLVHVDHSGQDAYSHSIAANSREVSIYLRDQDVTYLEHYISLLLLEHVFREEIQVVSALQAGERSSSAAFPYSSSYNVVFNLFVEDGRPVTWDIESALDVMKPIFSVFEDYCTFKISSQIQYYSKLHNEPHFNDTLRANVLNQNELSTFVNYGEWNLNTHDISPSINFLIYFAKSNYNKVPLIVENSLGNSFLIPQWGGVSVYNPELPILRGSNLNMDLKILQPILGVFASQLFDLLGVPKHPSSTPLRIDSFHRIAALKNLKLSLNNLAALMKLADSFSGISIPEATKKNVLESLSFYDLAVLDINKQDFASAAAHSAKSVTKSDKAFFEKEMVQQAYFPNEHKLAVFLPLLGPICSIVLFGLLKLIKNRKRDTIPKEKKEI